MNLKALFVPLLFSASFSFAQAPAPVVTSIAPVTSPSSGGIPVTITGDNLSPAIVCALPCPATVTFGTITVEAQEESDERIVVVTPAHAPGAVDVTIDVPGREPSRHPGAFTFTETPEDAWEKVLLPVYLDAVVYGSHGSRWRSSFIARNGGTAPVLIAPWTCEVCLSVLPNAHPLEPGVILHELPPHFSPPNGNPGRILYFSREGSRGMRFGLTIRDLSRGATFGGTEIPVIRESELLTDTAELFEIQLLEDYRVLLRIYDMSYSTSRFRVTLHHLEPRPALYSAELTASTATTGPFRTQPAYAQLDLSQLNLDANGFYRLEIEPLTPGSRFWAFATITNNTSQLVTTSTPQ